VNVSLLVSLHPKKKEREREREMDVDNDHDSTEEEEEEEEDVHEDMVAKLMEDGDLSDFQILKRMGVDSFERRYAYKCTFDFLTKGKKSLSKRDLRGLYDSVHMELSDEDLTYLMAIMNPHELDLKNSSSFVRFAMFMEQRIYAKQIDHAFEDAFYMFTEIGDRKHWHEIPDEDIVMTKEQLTHGLKLLDENSDDLIVKEDVLHMTGFKKQFASDMDTSPCRILIGKRENKIDEDQSNVSLETEEDEEGKLLRIAKSIQIDPNSNTYQVYFRMLKIHIPLHSILHKATLKGMGRAEVLALRMALEKV